jgi:hypothetical protein
MITGLSTTFGNLPLTHARPPEDTDESTDDFSDPVIVLQVLIN